jgi:hypothetical protein
MSSPIGERGRGEDGEEGAGQHVGTERDTALAGGQLQRDQRPADDSAEQEPGECADRDRAPAEPAEVEAEQRGQFHVTAAHAPDRKHAVEQVERAGGKEPTEQIGRVAGGQRDRHEQGGGHGVRRQNDLVGKAHHVEVDHRQGDRDGSEIEVRRKLPGPAEAGRDRDEQDRGAGFDQRVAGADPGAAVGAPAAEHQPAEDRDVVPVPDRVAALRAVRARVDE